MRAIHKKAIRDLWHMRGMALAIALVMACGVATFVMSLSTLASLEETQAHFYQTSRFADIFASLKRAPASLEARIAELPGVAVVETRVAAGASLDLPGYDEPVQGYILSIPDRGRPRLNDLMLEAGRFPEPYRDDEVIVSDGFAEAHQFDLGTPIRAVINGRRKTLHIVGFAKSPEYVYQLPPGGFIPDYEQFGILWMGRTPLGTAYDMEGAFNDVALTLTSPEAEDEVLDRLDALLTPYGGLGAYPRAQQQSHFYLSEEFRQLEQNATLLPAIFLGVAAFLLNVVVGRLIQTQRELIAVLKAFGYSNAQVAWHYVTMVSGIVAAGAGVGVVFGIWFGYNLSELYQVYYRLPDLTYILPTRVIIFAVLVSATAALAGTLLAVRRAAALPPAEAMRPEPPADYRRTLIERLGLGQWLDQPTRMILRHLERKPIKAALAVLGIACACAIIVMGRFFDGAIDEMMAVQFGLAQRDDLTVVFVEPTAQRALYSLEREPGVLHAEPFRAVPVRLRYQNRDYRTVIQGVMPGGDLYRVLNLDLEPVTMPPDGLVMTDGLGKVLGVAPGDTLVVEVLEGRRPIKRIPVAGFMNQYIGLGAYMDLDALSHLMGEGPSISGLFLTADANTRTTLNTALKDMPRVAGVSDRQKAIDDFYESMGGTWLIFALFITFFAAAIAFSVVYNSARIALSERSRELASLRILGFTKGEIAYILLGELALLTLLAIPVGIAMGWGICIYMVTTLQTELFRIPFVLPANTYAFAGGVVIVAAVLSGLIIRRRLDKLDLVAVLKTRD